MDYSSELENKLKTYIDDPSLAMNPAYNKNLLANRSYQEISEYLSKDKRIILPIGSTEQHGPDGILGVDHITATGIAILSQLSQESSLALLLTTAWLYIISASLAL